MIQQIPQNQLMDFWPYFKKHKLRNPLAQSLVWGKVEGFVDKLENPDVILFLCEQWACYLAGNSKAENLTELLMKIPEKAVIHAPSQEWEKCLKTQWTYFGYLPRTELSAKKISLQSIRRLLSSSPEGFQLNMVDVEVAKQILCQKFSDHFVGLINYFGSPEKLVEEGIGFCLIHESEKIASLVMGFKASLPITQSVELDIATHPDYRGRGFATLVSAKLIEYLLKKGIEPHWDAANPLSVGLAQKLGFTDPDPYRCYYWRKKPWTISELRESFNPQFERGLENINLLKSEIENKQVKKSKSYLISLLKKTRGTFEETLNTINRFLETEIVVESDIPQFNAYVEKIEQRLDSLELIENEIINIE
ncbi:MAG: GNAT family N-acetyltransferase [Promethearchaeota archaeon]